VGGVGRWQSRRGFRPLDPSIYLRGRANIPILRGDSARLGLAPLESPGLMGRAGSGSLLNSGLCHQRNINVVRTGRSSSNPAKNN
jgi:hypothetical protein